MVKAYDDPEPKKRQRKMVYVLVSRPINTIKEAQQKARRRRVKFTVMQACPYCFKPHNCSEDDGSEGHLCGAGCGRYFSNAEDEEAVSV